MINASMGNDEYRDHLYDNTTDGYIQLVKFNNGNIAKIYNTELKGLREVVEEVNGDDDTFITPNTTYLPKRRVENIRQFRALYIDLDNIEGDQLYISYKTMELAEKGEIPKPTMIINSGRGIHLYWRIKNAPYQALNTWQELEDYLYYKLKGYGADNQALDAARVLRLPGTINSKNNKECKTIFIENDLEYSMYNLREKYLGYKPKQLEFQETKQKTNNKVINNKFFNSYSLHMARAEDMETLCRIRRYSMTGYRNMVIHCFAYWRGLVVRDIEVLEKDVIDLNNSFTEPLRETQVNAVLRCIPKAIDKFIMYENDVRAGIKRRVTKGMRDKEGYWYKNETLIERLDITPEEQTHLKTIIGTKEKYKRNNMKRTPRNENGLTSREQQKQDTIKSIKELKIKGFTQKEVANKLNKGLRTVKLYWNL